MGANEKHEATYHGGEYTPDEKQLRNAYLNVFTGERNETSNAEFDRGITKIKAEAWDEAVKWYGENITCPRTCGDCSRCVEDDTYNPYK